MKEEGNKNYRPWGLQTELQESNAPKIQELIWMFEAIESKRDKALCVLCYQTGGRISEVVHAIRKIDIRFEASEDQQKQFMIVTMPNRKHRKKHSKEIPIPIHKEEKLIKMIKDYLEEKKDQDLLFDFSRTRAYQIIKKELGYNPHYLRHLRATHYVTVYNLPASMIQRLMGHSDIRPLTRYLELQTADIMKAL